MVTTSNNGRPAKAGGIRRLAFYLLLASIGLAGAGAWQSWKAMRSHQATAEALLQDYGAFAAWSFERRAREILGASLQRSFRPVEAAGPACTPDLILEAKAKAKAEAEANSNGQADACDCPPILVGAWTFKLALSDDPSQIEFAGAAPVQSDRELVRRAVLDAVAAHDARWASIAMIPSPLEGDESLMAYRIVHYTAGGISPGLRRRLAAGETLPRDTLVFGFQVSGQALQNGLATLVQDRDILPAALQREGAESPLSLALTDAAGRTLFSSGRALDPALASAEIMPGPLGGLVARAAVVPDAAQDLIIGGLPRSRVPFLLGLFALAAALAFVALGQLRREEDLARLRSDFVASVSHELRTPLAQMRLFVETLRLGRTRNDEEREWSLENIDRETLRLSHLVENVLHFSRAERGTLSGKLESVDLAAEVRQVEASFRPLTTARRRTRATLVTHVPEGLTARVHRESFRQILLNFLDNAVKYGAAGQTVRMVGERRNGSVRISVEDQGPGVPPGERERIWEPFRRGEGAVGSVAVGSGIGLSVAREIARRHGGRTWVESAATGGARFVVEVPAGTVAAAEEEAQA